MRPLKPKNSFSCFTHGFTCEFELELHTHSRITSHSHTTAGALRFSLRLLHICLNLKEYMGVSALTTIQKSRVYYIESS